MPKYLFRIYFIICLAVAAANVTHAQISNARVFSQIENMCKCMILDNNCADKVKVRDLLLEDLIGHSRKGHLDSKMDNQEHSIGYISSLVTESIRSERSYGQMENIKLMDVDVTFDNRIGTTQAGGSIHIYSSNYNESNTTPFTRSFPPYTAVEEYTEQDRLPVGVETNKHNNWGLNLSYYKMKREFTVPDFLPEGIQEVAYFEPMYETAFETHFEDASNAIGLEFRDPWNVASGVCDQPDQYTSVPSGFTPTGHWDKQSGGIMAHMNFRSENPEYPYYAMRVPWTLAANKVAKDPLTIEIGDWVCIGMFPSIEGAIVTKFAGLNWMSPSYNNYFTRSIELEQPQSGVTVTAEYKAHQLSRNQLPPTRINSQRKVAAESDIDAFYIAQHSVYESDGKIYYSRSTDNGLHWGPEQLVSSYYKSSKRPCIAVSHHGWVDRAVYPVSLVPDAFNDVIYITYIEHNPNTGKDEVVLRFKAAQLQDEEVWEEIDRIETDADCTPVVASPMPDGGAAFYNEISSCVLVWEDVNVLKYSIYINTSNDSYEYVPLEDENSVIHRALVLANGRYYRSVQLQPSHPSITAMPVREYSRALHIAWNERTYTGMKPLNYVFRGQAQSGTSVSLYPAINVFPPSSSASIEPTQAISITYHDRGPAIAYETQNPIVSAPSPNRYPVPTMLGAPISLGSKSYYQISAPWPISLNTVGVQFNNTRFVSVLTQDYTTITGYTYPRWWTLIRSSSNQSTSCRPILTSGFTWHSWSDDLIVALNETTNSFYRANIKTSRGSYVSSMPGLDGVDPNTNSVGTSTTCIYTLNASAPFDYKIGSSKIFKTKQVEHPVMKQVIVRTADSAFAKYGIVLPVLSSDDGDLEYINWANEPDTLINGSPPNMEDMAKTAPFTVPAGGLLKYGVEMFAFAKDDFDSNFSFDIKIYDVSSDELLSQEQVHLADLPADSSMYLLYKRDLDSLTGHTVYMTLGVSDTSQSMSSQLIRIAILDDFSAEKRNNQQIIPASGGFSLSQNYPNPFNPVTTIPFYLSKKGHVRLCILDALGREIKVLVDETRLAGSHHVYFNAGNLPSGSYLCRMDFNDSVATMAISLVK